MLLVAPFGMTFLEETMQLQEEQQQQMQQSAKDVSFVSPCPGLCYDRLYGGCCPGFERDVFV